jgi:hypothetical protein
MKIENRLNSHSTALPNKQSLFILHFTFYIFVIFVFSYFLAYSLSLYRSISEYSASDCPSVRPILAILSLFFQYSRTQAVCAQGHFCPFCTIFTLQPILPTPSLTPSVSFTPSLPHSLTPSFSHSSHSSHSLILASAELFYLQHARSRGVDFARERARGNAE